MKRKLCDKTSNKTNSNKAWKEDSMESIFSMQSQRPINHAYTKED